jgi:hypothetical protein
MWERSPGGSEGFRFSTAPVPGHPEPRTVILTARMASWTMEKYLMHESRHLAPREWDATMRSKAIFGIVAGMDDLHSRNIVHRDLRTDSSFFDPNLDPVIGDFGLPGRLMCSGRFAVTRWVSMPPRC